MYKKNTSNLPFYLLCLWNSQYCSTIVVVLDPVWAVTCAFEGETKWHKAIGQIMVFFNVQFCFNNNAESQIMFSFRSIDSNNVNYNYCECHFMIFANHYHLYSKLSTILQSGFVFKPGISLARDEHSQIRSRGLLVCVFCTFRCHTLTKRRLSYALNANFKYLYHSSAQLYAVFAKNVFFPPFLISSSCIWESAGVAEMTSPFSCA